tara:strand:- start:629 stop:1234 length:606 start_codon:yes stop_codon:yes gene_type:complete
MKRFLSNFFCNFSLITYVFCILFFFNSETKSESNVLESVNILHKSLIKISKKTIKSKDLALMDDVVKNSYDLERMGKMIIGVKWKQMETKMQEEFINVFKRFISVNYLRRFNKIIDLDFEYQSVRVIEDKFRLAGVILMADNERIKIDYLLGFNNDQWKIFDVLLDGSISEIATKKSDFKKIINEEGVSGLIKNLRLRNQF